MKVRWPFIRALIMSIGLLIGKTLAAYEHPDFSPELPDVDYIIRCEQPMM